MLPPWKGKLGSEILIRVLRSNRMTERRSWLQRKQQIVVTLLSKELERLAAGGLPMRIVEELNPERAHPLRSKGWAACTDSTKQGYPFIPEGAPPHGPATSSRMYSLWARIDSLGLSRRH